MHDRNGNSSVCIDPRRVKGKNAGLRRLAHILCEFARAFTRLEDAVFEPKKTGPFYFSDRLSLPDSH